VSTTTPTRTRLADISVDTGEAGKIEVLALSDLKVDPVYQRDLTAAFVERLAEQWDIITAGAIVVSKRPGGDLYIVDGQHRAAAAVRAGETHILAQVVNEPSAEEEARLRLKGNVKRTDRVFEVFRARLAAHDEVAEAMVGILDGFDTQINMTPTTHTGINAVTAVEKLYRLDNGVTLIKILGMLKKLFGEIRPDIASSDLLKGLTWFLGQHEDSIDMERFERVFKLMGPAALSRSARAHKASLGGSLWVNTYRGLVTMYNEGLSDASKLDWKTRGSTSWKASGGGIFSRGGESAW
jgi:ParB-like nuclease domain